MTIESSFVHIIPIFIFVYFSLVKQEQKVENVTKSVNMPMVWSVRKNKSESVSRSAKKKVEFLYKTGTFQLYNLRKLILLKK